MDYLKDVLDCILKISGNLTILASCINKEIDNRQKDYYYLQTNEKNTQSKINAIERLNEYFKNQLAINKKSKGNSNFIKHENKTKERGKQEKIMQKGSISKRSDGRYMGRYYENGKVKCIYAYTQKDIILKLRQAILTVEKNKKNNESNKNLTVNEWYNTWKEVYKKTQVKESSLVVYDRVYARTIKAALGDKIITKLSVLELQEFFSCIKSKSTNTIAYIILNEMFRKLHENGLVQKNNLSLVVRNKEKDSFISSKDITIQSDQVLTPEQLKLLFETPYQPKEANIRNLMLLLRFTGLRLGEALALSVGDIDFQNNQITINKQYNLTTCKITPPKSNKGNRFVPLFETTKNLLLSLENVNWKNDKELIIKIKKYHSVCRKISSFGAARNIVVTAKMFRKTFSSYCQFDLNIPIKIIQEWLGHSNSNITNEFYTFANKNLIEECINKINSDTHFDT